MLLLLLGNLISLDVLIMHGNDILGPIPRSLSKLTRLRDFSCFSNCPTENFKIPRAFQRRTYERLFVVAPNMRVDTVYWDRHRLYGDKLPEEQAAEVAAAAADAHAKRLAASKVPGRRGRRGAPVEEPAFQVELPHEPTYRLKCISSARAIKFNLNDV